MCSLCASAGQFCDMLDALIVRAQSLGIFQAYAEIATPADTERADDLLQDFMNEGTLA